MRRPIYRTADIFLRMVLCAALSGCTLLQEGNGLQSGWGLFGDKETRAGGPARKLPGIPASRDALQLEVLFIERPVGDSLLGDELWNEVDQVGSLESETRLALSQNGIRVGHLGSEPPRALAQMLDLKSEHSGESGGNREQNLVGRRIVLASGGETEVQVGSLFPECLVEISAGESTKTKEFKNARFVFRLKAERIQDGWARVEVLPEVHHGANRLRRVSGNAGWELRTAQDVYRLYNQRFSLLLNVGEMAIVTSGDEKPASVGRHFFLGVGENENVQRVLIVRLSDMVKTDPVYAE